MRMRFFFSLLTCWLLVPAPELKAQSVPTDLPPDSIQQLKRRYSWRRPVPAALLRPLSTDRPDATESAYSLDAGHFQLEADVLRLTHQRLAEKTYSQEVAYSHANLKLGLYRNTDLQVILETYTRRKEKTTAATARHAGFGDVTVRVKHNLWGNDGGQTALALLPFVKLPTSQLPGSHAAEAGLVLPFACQLPRNWTLGTQAQATWANDDETATHYLELAPTITLGHDLYQQLGGFVEIATAWDTRQAAWSVTCNEGLTLRIGQNLQLDAGAMVPLTANTPISGFLGLSIRR